MLTVPSCDVFPGVGTYWAGFPMGVTGIPAAESVVVDVAVLAVGLAVSVTVTVAAGGGVTAAETVVVIDVVTVTVEDATGWVLHAPSRTLAAAAMNRAHLR